ncbi:ribbon-helix-helix domain-containing protein [Archaeoglobus sp.]
MTKQIDTSRIKIPKNIALRLDQHRLLKELSSETGKSVSEIVREALDQYFSKLGR